MGISRSKGPSPSPTKEKVTGTAPPRRERPSRRVEKTLVPVDVAMTTLEQDIYARMGISPLIKTEYADQDPRSFMVSVVTAGAALEGNTNGSGSLVNAVITTVDNGDNGDNVPSDGLTIVSEVTAPTPVIEQPREETVEPEQVVLPQLDDETPAAPVAEESAPIETKKRPGRRRRRSSAE